MKNRKPLIISLGIMIITIGLMFINFCFYSFSDWIVRIDGIIMLLCIPVVTYNTIKIRSTR